MIKNLCKSSFGLIIIILLFNGCSSLKKTQGKKLDPNLDNRITERAAKGGGILANITNRNTTFEFSTSNPLWRATLNTLDFVPLNSVNYSGGIIVSDWYSSSLNSNESIKIEVRFLTSEIKASAVKVISYKRICQQNSNNNCKTIKISENFNRKIQNTILAKARELKIKDETIIKK